MSSDQKEFTQDILKTLVEPYRTSDRDEVTRCLEAQGGLDECRLAFFESDDIGDDGVWDNWRLEGPSFVWHFRGAPHVHVWVGNEDVCRIELNGARFMDEPPPGEYRNISQAYARYAEVIRKTWDDIHHR